jgi:hypothetical protein
MLRVKPTKAVLNVDASQRPPDLSVRVWVPRVVFVVVMMVVLTDHPL